jgi:hypothetical protein
MNKTREQKSHATVPFIFVSRVLLGKIHIISYRDSELGTRFFLRFALALSRSLAELFTLALSRSFLGLKFCAFAFVLSRSRAP